MEIFFPKSALPDIRTFVRLTPEQFERLSGCFDAPTSVGPYEQFIDEVRRGLDLSSGDARSVGRVGTFLLSATDQGVQPDIVVDDLSTFLAEVAGPDDELADEINKKRTALVAFLGPKPRRERAAKIRYLRSGPHGSATSFRTVCDLRPVFDDAGDQIEGLIPTVFLEVKTEEADGEEKTQVIHLSRDKLKELREVLDRTQKKFEAMDRRYGKDFVSE